MIPQEWIWPAIAALVVLLIAVLGVFVWRRRSNPIERALADVAVQMVKDVLLPDGMGGQIHVEYLLLTVRGIVVVDVKRFGGVIFASDRMTEWTVMGKRRFTFPNPQSALYDRMAALRQLVRDVPVEGHVLFSAEADFSKGKPRDVLLPTELAEIYAKPAKPEVERIVAAFLPQWQAVLGATEPATFTARAAER